MGARLLREGIKALPGFEAFLSASCEVIHTQRKNVTAPSLERAFEPFLMAPVIALAVRLKLSNGVRNLKPCFKIKSVALCWDHIAVSASHASSEHASPFKASTSFHMRQNAQFLDSDKNKV